MKAILNDSPANLFVISVEKFFEDYVHPSDADNINFDIYEEFNLIKLIRHLLVIHSYPANYFSKLGEDKTVRKNFHRITNSWLANILDTHLIIDRHCGLNRQFNYARLLFMTYDSNGNGVIIPTKENIDRQLVNTCSQIFDNLCEINKTFNSFLSHNSIQYLQSIQFVNTPLSDSNMQYINFIAHYLLNPPKRIISTDGYQKSASIEVDTKNFEYELSNPIIAVRKYQLLALLKELITKSPFSDEGKKIVQSISNLSDDLDVNYQSILNNNFLQAAVAS